MDIQIPEATETPAKPEGETKPPLAPPAEPKTPVEPIPPAGPDEKPKGGEGGEPEKPEKPKEPESRDEGFAKHSRFKEIIVEKNRLAQERDAALRELEESRSGERRPKAPVPGEEDLQFETIDDLTAYLKGLPAKIVQATMEKLEHSRTEGEARQARVQEIIDSQLQDLRDSGEKFDENELLGFASKYRIPNLTDAFAELKARKEEIEKAKQEGEELAKRKLQSGVPEKGGGAAEKTGSYIPGRSLDETLEAAKETIPK